MTHWLVSYRGIRWWVNGKGCLVNEGRIEGLDFIDKHPLQWVIDQKKLIAALRKDPAANKGETGIDVELIFSSVECPDGEWAADWWRDHV